ncbi:MAG: hypothetical protein C4321_03430, partial [Chloroflexota bacterium]
EGRGALGPYLAHVHVKNALWARDNGATGRWKATWAPLAEGIVHWPDVLAALNSVDYDGWLSFEDFAPGDTRDKLHADLEYI